MALDDSVFDDSDLQKSPMQTGLPDSVFDDSDLGKKNLANVPGSLSSSFGGLLNSALAAGAGATKGLWNPTASLFNMASKLTPVGALSEIMPTQVRQLNQLPVLNNEFGQSLKNDDISNLAFKGGELVGGAAPLLAAPELDAASVLGKMLPKTGEYLSTTGLGKFISKALNSSATNAAVGGASAPFYNQNPNESVKDKILGGATIGGETGFAAPFLLAPFGLAGRLADVATANADKIGLDEGSAYNAINNEANANNFYASPDLYEDKLNDIKDLIDSSATGHINENISKDINRRLKNLPEDLEKENGFTVSGVHGLMRGLNKQINDFYRFGDKDSARIYTELKDSLQDDLLNSLDEQGLGHLGDRFMQTQNNWAQNVVPLQKYPTSLGNILGQMAAYGAVSKLPTPVKNFGEIAVGVNALGSTMGNLARRFGSTYKGGIGQAALNPQFLAPYLSRMALAQANNNEQQ